MKSPHGQGLGFSFVHLNSKTKTSVRLTRLSIATRITLNDLPVLLEILDINIQDSGFGQYTYLKPKSVSFY